MQFVLPTLQSYQSGKEKLVRDLEFQAVCQHMPQFIDLLSTASILERASNEAAITKSWVIKA